MKTPDGREFLMMEFLDGEPLEAYMCRMGPLLPSVALGIADRRAPAATLVDEAKAWAKELSQGSSTALALGKSILNQTFELSVSQVFNLGAQAQGICYSSTEHRASVEAFLAKSASPSPGP